MIDAADPSWFGLPRLSSEEVDGRLRRMRDGIDPVDGKTFEPSETLDDDEDEMITERLLARSRETLDRLREELGVH